jgi:hypothetical protein
MVSPHQLIMVPDNESFILKIDPFYSTAQKQIKLNEKTASLTRHPYNHQNTETIMAIYTLFAQGSTKKVP